MRIINKLAYKIMLATLKPAGFNEIKKGYYINSSSLADWLYYLGQCSLLVREVSSRPIRVTYKLTPKGKEMLEKMIDIHDCEPKMTTDEGYK